jgi:hypothetical protein
MENNIVKPKKNLSKQTKNTIGKITSKHTKKYKTCKKRRRDRPDKSTKN